MHPSETAHSGTAKRRLSGLLAWASYDWASSAFPTIVLTFVFAAYFTRQVAADPVRGPMLWGRALALAGLAVAVTAPVFGAVMDQAGRRKRWLALFTFLCVGATALLWSVKPDPQWIMPALTFVVIAVITEEWASVAYNAMLPTLAPENELGRWSGWGWALGYVGGLTCLLVALFGFVRQPAWFPLNPETAAPVRAVFLLAAGWYGLFSLPLFLLTPDSPARGLSPRQVWQAGLKQLADSFGHARQHADIIRFLVAHMIYVDGLACVFAFGGVFAAAEFHMSEQQVLQFGITLNVTAGLGAALLGWLDDRIGSRRTILLSLVGLIIPSMLMLAARRVIFFWLCGLALGVFVGPVQSASRSLLARLAPPELRHEMFGLYAFSGKVTAFLGPFLVGTITAATGSLRIGMSMLIVLFILGGLLLLTVTEPRSSHAHPAAPPTG